MYSRKEKQPAEGRKHQLIRTSLESGSYLIILVLVTFALVLQIVQTHRNFKKWASGIKTIQYEENTGTHSKDNLVEPSAIMEEGNKPNSFFVLVLKKPRLIGMLYMLLMTMIGITWAFIAKRPGIPSERKNSARYFVWLFFSSALVFFIKGYEPISTFVMTVFCSIRPVWRALVVMGKKHRAQTYISRGFGILLIFLNCIFFSGYPVFILTFLFYRTVRSIMVLYLSHFQTNAWMNIEIP